MMLSCSSSSWFHCQPEALFWGMQRKGEAAEPGAGGQKQDVPGDGESRSCRALINSPWWRGGSREGT